MVQVKIMQEDNPDLTAPPPPPPPPHQRRPRVREVSSRFMSPAMQRRHQTKLDPTVDENSETPYPMGCSVSQRKQPQPSMKFFKENNNGHEQVPPHPSKSCSGRIGCGNSTPCVSGPVGISPELWGRKKMSGNGGGGCTISWKKKGVIFVPILPF